MGWTENVIIVNADYIDKVAFDLTVNFERMLGRRIPPADIARWTDCVALDGGLREGEHETHLVLIHDRKNLTLENFKPSDYKEDLNGKAFKDNLGKFTISSLPVEDIVDRTEFFLDVLNTVYAQEEVKRVMVVPDAEKDYDSVRNALRHVDDEKCVTVFVMQPMPGGNFRQEILGYSLMNALGIKAEEIR